MVHGEVIGVTSPLSKYKEDLGFLLYVCLPYRDILMIGSLLATMIGCWAITS